MRPFLGDEEEERLRKAEFRSILSATVYGWLFGGLVGGVLGGYGWFLLGMCVGSFVLSLLAILGVKASRRNRERERRKAEAKPVAGLPARRRGPTQR